MPDSASVCWNDDYIHVDPLAGRAFVAKAVVATPICIANWIDTSGRATVYAKCEYRRDICRHRAWKGDRVFCHRRCRRRSRCRSRGPMTRSASSPKARKKTGRQAILQPHHTSRRSRQVAEFGARTRGATSPFTPPYDAPETGHSSAVRTAGRRGSGPTS
jgi:hypothetical protein